MDGQRIESANFSVERLNDHELARHLAAKAGHALLALREEAARLGTGPWELRDQGDKTAHDLLVSELATHRSDDAVLSEEGVDDPVRLQAERTWIIDPLDGTSDYPRYDSGEWAVHVALVCDGRPVAAAVTVPVLGWEYGTDIEELPPRGDRPKPLVISSRSNVGVAMAVAEHLDAEVAACGSAGVKAMLVVNGDADIYIHESGLYEWDVCAPAAVAAAAGLTVSDMAGREILYNKPDPVVRGLVIARPGFSDAAAHVLGW